MTYRLRVLLIGGFLVSGLIPLMILSLASYRTAHEELKRQAFRQLEAVRDIKRQQVLHYFQERFADLRVFSATPSLQQACRELFLPGATNGRPAGRTESCERHEPYLRMLLSQYGYQGLYLVDGTDGSVLLACEEGRSLSESGSRPPPHERLAGSAATASAHPDRHQPLRRRRPRSGPVSGRAVGGTSPCQRRHRRPSCRLRPISAMMKERSGMGQSGETYLVGADRRMRSDSHLDPRQHSVLASLAGTIERNGADTESVDPGPGR